MKFFTTKLGISITLLILAVVFLIFLQSGVFGGAFINLTLTTNPDLESGLVGHWSFDGELEQQVTDRSGNGNTAYFGTSTAQATSSLLTAGTIGQGIKLDGVNDYVATTFDPSFNATGFSMSVWFFTSGTGTGIDFFAGSSLGNASIITFGILHTSCGAAGQLVFEVGDDDQNEFDQLCTNNEYNDGTWHHAVAVHDPANTSFSIYVDGVLDNTAAITADSDGLIDSPTLFLGAYNNNNNGAALLYEGSLDDFRVYNRPLSADEVKRLYELGATTKVNTTITTNPDLESGLVGHWTFDGDLVPQVSDRSGQGNTGYFNSSSQATSSIVVPGRIGQGVQFDGSNDSVVVDDSSSLDISSEITLSAWVSLDLLDGSSDAIITKSNVDFTQHYRLDKDNSPEQFLCGLGIDSTEEQLRADTITPEINRWYHLLCAYDGNDMKIYVNGVLSNESNVPGSITTNNDDLFIGSRIGGNNWPGKIDDVRIYDRALSAAEVKRLYELGATTKVNTTITTNPDLESGLVGHWTFDGDLVPQVSDRSGQGNHGYFSTTSQATSSMVTSGKIGQGVQFDGVDDYINVGNPTELQITSALTVAAWVKSNTNQNAVVISKYSSEQNLQSFRLQTDQGTTHTDYDMRVHETCDGAVTAAGEVEVEDGVWHHIVGVYEPSTAVRLYIDGSLASENTTSIPASIADCVVDVYIGARDDAFPEFWNGLIDDPRIYNRVLSAEEVSRLYQLGR